MVLLPGMPPYRLSSRRIRKSLDAADRKFKRPLLRLRRFPVSYSGGIGSGLALVDGLTFVTRIVSSSSSSRRVEEIELTAYLVEP